MTACGICKAEVETHRYLRAEPLKVEEVRGRERLSPVQLKVSAFYCLGHPLEAIEEAIAKEYPPSAEMPVRLLWSPAPGVRVAAKSMVVRERTSKTGDHNVRTAIIADRAALHLALPEVLPPGTNWYVPHAGARPEDVMQAAAGLFGADDPLTQQIRDRLAGKGS